MAQVHVIFGGGALGNAVARACVARGHTTRIATRSGRTRAPDGVDPVRADATDVALVEKACAGATAVYNCASPAYTDWPTALPPIQAGLIAGVGAAGARLVSAENVYVYGRVEAPMTEDTAWNPCSKKGELRARLNRALLDAHQAGTVQAVLGRGPDYYGPEATLTTIYGDTVFGKAVLGKTADIFGEKHALHTFAYVDDFARGLVTLGESPSALGKVWHLPAPAALTQQQLLDIISSALGGPVNARPMPGFLLSLLSMFMPIMRELQEMEYQWRMPYDFRCDRFMQEFPETTITPHDVGVCETVAWFKARTPR